VGRASGPMSLSLGRRWRTRRANSLKAEVVADLSIEERTFGVGRDEVLKSLFWHAEELVGGAISELDFEQGSDRAVGNRDHRGGVDKNPGHRRFRFDCTHKPFQMLYVLDMPSPDCSNLLLLYQQALSVGTLEYFQKQANVVIRRGVYCAQVVLWLLILQRLHAVGTLSAAVQLLLQGAADPLLQNCQRVRKRKISARTGGYCQARQKLPALLCRQVTREITLKLRHLLGFDEKTRRSYLLDGSSLELEHGPELAKLYPPARNQFGVSHWPVLKMVVLHDLESGLAEVPQWGPMYGAHAVSEQELAVKAMDQLPAHSVLVGDRNFGVLWVAYEAQRRGLGVVIRLTDVRARKLMGGPISCEGEYPVQWKATRWDGGKHHSLPDQAAVSGRLIAVRLGRGRSKEWLYLFTTMSGSVEDIVALYGRRWSIETDLRSLKRTVRLHHMAVKSQDLLEKELLMAVCAYNLVRAVMCLAAQRSKIDSRQLSFAMVLNVVDCAWPKLATATSIEDFDRQFQRILTIAAQCTLPKRKTRRSYPRAIWRHEPGFPNRKAQGGDN